MSEQVLKALMQLFAIIAKQDGGLEENELEYVNEFLSQQLGDGNKERYLRLFSDSAGQLNINRNKEKDSKLTSVLDSVRILGICRKINKTLNQTQKTVVLLRLFELVASDMKVSPQRMAIISTVANVFNIDPVDYADIESFVFNNNYSDTNNLLLINEREESKKLHIHVEKLDGEIVILRIKAINLYFIKYTGTEDLFLNGLGLHKNRIYILPKGSTIRMPKGKPEYYSDIANKFLDLNKPQKISFVVENLEYRFTDGILGLKNINFSAGHGNLIGILGLSGTGKTTLLNILSGFGKPSSGKIIINGREISGRKDSLPDIRGYIPQDDLLMEELTVFENLYFNAKLCFGDLSENDIRKKVNDTLENLGLFDIKDLKTGSVFNKTISGGQRKRLNIALELIREPSILFVDEPTSGLSSRDSENVMDLLRELSLKGKLIFTVIHQPSSEIFKMFDKVIILDKGGRMVYFGNPVESVMYFKKLDSQINSELGECPACGNVNPELIFDILEARIVDEYGNYTRKRKISPEKWEQFYREQAEPEKVKDTEEFPHAGLRISSRLKQMRIYIKRDLKSKLSNTQYVLLTLLEAPALAFILAYIIRYIADPNSGKYVFRENENIPVYIFMMLIVAAFLGLTLSAQEIFRDRKILMRERFLKMSRSGYLMAKITILFLISALQALIFVAVANNILEIRNMHFYYWFAFFTTAACANLIGLNISSGLNSAITIYIVIPLLIIPMMVLSGAMFSFNKLNRNISSIDKVPFLAELMPTRWSYEALMVHQFKNNFFQETFYELDKKIINADFKQSYFIPELQEILRKLREEYTLRGNITNKRDLFLVLKNELLSENLNTSAFEIQDKSMFQAANFTPGVADRFENMLRNLSLYYLDIFTTHTRAKNNKVKNHLKNQKEIYYKYLDVHFNESLSDHVRKIYEKNKIVEYDHRLLRMTDPVYLDPSPKHFWDFRTHFFAPRKYFTGKYFDTFWFNMSLIWIMTFFLFILLYFDVLRKVIQGKKR